MLYRIFTQRKRMWGVKRICGRFFDAYTVLPAHGVWRGKSEKSVCIEVYADKRLEERVNAAAAEIRELNGQECVLVQCLSCTSIFV